MASRLKKVTVYDRALQGLFAPSADVADYTNRVTSNAKRIAITIAPVGGHGRAGKGVTIRDSHYTSYIRQGAYIGRGFLGNTAEHSLWVAQGVRGMITSRKPGGWLAIPTSMNGPAKRDGGSTKAVRGVRGQAGQGTNNWLARAVTAAVNSTPGTL